MDRQFKSDTVLRKPLRLEKVMQVEKLLFKSFELHHSKTIERVALFWVCRWKLNRWPLINQKSRIAYIGFIIGRLGKTCNLPGSLATTRSIVILQFAIQDSTFTTGLRFIIKAMDSRFKLLYFADCIKNKILMMYSTMTTGTASRAPPCNARG